MKHLKLVLLKNFVVIVTILSFSEMQSQSWSPEIRGQLRLGLSDGTGSGEGIFNRRPTATNRQYTHLYGIALFTNFRTRMVIDNAGKVVIGDDVQWDFAEDRLDVKDGNILVRGTNTTDKSMIRMKNSSGGELRTLYATTSGVHRIGFSDGSNNYYSDSFAA